MKKRTISFITLMMFVITNIISTVPVVSADEQESILYEYDDYTVEYSILETWEDTKKVSVSINNTGEEVIENWMIYFEPNGEIYDIWDAEKAITTQPIAYIRNSKYNANIQPNENSKFSYLIKNNENAPESFSLCQNRKDIEEGFQVDLKELNCWEDTKFQGEIYLTNITSDPLESWELTVDTNFTIEKITNSWAAEVTELSEGRYLLKGNYNSIVQPYSSVVLGFLGVKNGTPEISDYSLSVVSVDEPFLSSIITKQFEDEPIPELSMYARANIQDNEIEISWIPNKEISGVEYKIFEIADEHSSLCVGSTNDLSFGYTLENNFINKRLYVEAYYNDLFVGKSNEFIVQNNDGIFCSELIDTDGDNISDYIENTIGTDATKADTDDDGLNDYQEFFVLETDPLKKDSDDNGILDGDEDCDSDGLTNLSELEKSTNPVMSDSDNDKLSDYDELFTYNTNPLLEDTDMDGVNDYDEIMLGINPNNSSDSDKIVDQIIDVDDECLNGVNVEGLPYNISMNIKASGYVAGSLKAENSLSYSSTYSVDTIGEIPEFSYNNGNVEDVTINFDFDENYINENYIDFDSLNIFKYYDEVNMFIPQKTIRNENEKILSCESESLGTFCVKDINDWMANFVDSDVESENISFLSSNSNAMAKSTENNGIDANSSNTESTNVNVVFAVDGLQFSGMMVGDRPNQIKQNIINVSEELFKRYKNVNIYLVYYYDASYIEICKSIDEVKNLVNYYPFIETQSLSQCIEKPINDVKMILSNVEPNYYFIYNGTYFSPNQSESDIEQFETALKKEKYCHMCFVSSGSFLAPGYIDYYAQNYNGEVFNLFSETIDNEVISFIAKEPKLKRNTAHVIPGDSDEPIDDTPENVKSNRYVLSSNLTTVTLDAPLTKNSTIDTDKDGLTDVEELIQSEELVRWDEDGNIILPTVFDIIRECGGSSDYMVPTGLSNRFLKVIPVRSNPIKEDTDYDGLSDYEEIIEHATNTLKYNKIVSIQDVDVLTEDSRYAATALKSQYEGDAWESELAVFIANNLFGSTHDYKVVYKEALLSYFKDINDYIIEDEKEFNESEYLYNVNICTQIQAVISLALKSGVPFYDNIDVDYNYMLRDLENSGKILDKNLFQYCKGKLSRSKFIDVNEKEIGKALDNKIFRYYYVQNKIGASVRFINNGMKYFDKLNTFVTYASIVETGFMSINTSLNDMFDVLIYSDVIEKNITTLIHIQYSTNSLFLREAAEELKDEIESKSLNFFAEIINMSNLFCHNVGDGLTRMKIASCSGAGTLIIAEIALLDKFLSISSVGLKFLNAYAYASISEVLAKDIRNASTKLLINGTVYEHISIGEYVIYNSDESDEFINSVKSLCIARVKGENEILEMEHWNTKKWVSFLGVDTFFENVKYNRDYALEIYGKL